jgi:hypothetical protein
MSVCVNMATATGKTATLSALAQRFVAKGHSICVVTHVQELVGQILRTAQNFMPPEDIGVQAASLGRKDPPRKFQICQIQIFADQNQFHRTGINSHSIIPDNVRAFHLPHPPHNPLHQILQTEKFGNHIFYFREKGVQAISTIDFSLTLILCQQQSSLSQSIEFYPHRIGRFIKFLGQSTQVA